MDNFDDKKEIAPLLALLPYDKLLDKIGTNKKGADGMEKDKLVEKVLAYVKQNVTNAAYDGFISKITFQECTDDPKIAYLSTNKGFITNVIKNRYIPVIERAFLDTTGETYRVIIKNQDEYASTERPVFTTLAPQGSKEKTPPARLSKTIAFSPLIKEKYFNPNYTFENFVVGESNKYANAACKAVASTPSEIYNPLFIYGKSGLGKTHLMNAIGIYILEHSDKRILYVSSETFTNDFIKALQEGKTEEFKNKYRKADALLVDDIQFLEGKEGTQEEFFHTFNTLYEDRKQIVLSSDRPPNKLTDLDERLRSRFGWHMIAEIQAPDYETRIAILRKKAENMNVPLDEDMYQIISLISEKIQDNIRELEGAFSRVISFSQLLNEKADVAFARTILKDILAGSTTITPEKIKSVVCKYYKIKLFELDSKTRKISIAYPRQIAMYLCRNLTDYSLPKIGKLFGDKHYSTVKHACDKIEEERKTDKNLLQSLEEMEKMIRS